MTLIVEFTIKYHFGKMLPSLLSRGARQSRNCAQAVAQFGHQQKRFLNIHEYQVRFSKGNQSEYISIWLEGLQMKLAQLTSGEPDLCLFRPLHTNIHTQSAQLMSKYGVHVPEGLPAFSLQDVKDATEKLADEKGEVGVLLHTTHTHTQKHTHTRARKGWRRKRGGGAGAADCKFQRVI